MYLVTVSSLQINRLLAITNLKTYFAVDTSYVLKKLSLLLFPYTHRNWMVGYGESGRTSPKDDINAPDLYIPGQSVILQYWMRLNFMFRLISDCPTICMYTCYMSFLFFQRKRET